MKRNIALFLILLAAVFAAGFLYNISQKESETREIIALVNGQPLYAEQLEKELATLTPEQRNVTTREEVLGFLIEKTTLLQEADKEGVSATQLEIIALYDSYPDPETAMEQQGLSQEEFVARMAEQATISKLLETKIADSPIVRNEEVQEFYELNYAGQDVPFEEVEEEIVHFLAENRPQIMRERYVQLLKDRAIVDVLI